MTKQEMDEILDRYSLQTICDIVYLNGYRIGFIDWLQSKTSAVYYFIPRDMNSVTYFKAEEVEKYVQQKILEVKQEKVEQGLNKIKEDFK
ncbi:MAG: hypothetical protein J6V44_17620 [Methanobrevibacter sp.]|nr:hypothetical protein [Methanobrevibacter sp.]